MLLNPQPCNINHFICFLILILTSFILLAEYCDPLGSFNTFVPLLTTNKSQGDTKPRSVVIIAARMDSASLFDGLALGADTALTGAVTLVAVTDILRQVQSDIQKAGQVDNIFLVLFQGEAFDYIGSSRMVYDMINKKFPREINPNNPSQSPLVGLEHVKFFIELGSLAPHGNPTIYTHTDPLSTAKPVVNSEVTVLLSFIRLEKVRRKMFSLGRKNTESFEEECWK